jgi:hypothetical protein
VPIKTGGFDGNALDKRLGGEAVGGRKTFQSNPILINLLFITIGNVVKELLE